MKDPQVIKDLFDTPDFLFLKNTMFNSPKDKNNYDKGFGRYYVNHEILQEYTEKVLPIARECFKSKTLLPSYTLFAHYEGQDPAPSLYKHKDDNACTYTLDLCVYQNEPWDLWVEDKNYTLSPNQALAYYGNDQKHWREKFPNPETNNVAMIFFHFVEPEHWWFTKSPTYIDVIRGKVSEDAWKTQNGRK